MKLVRLKNLGGFADQWGEWVVCEAVNKQQWVVPKKVFEQFKYLGLPTLDPKMEATFHRWLVGKHYPALPKEERYRLIKQMLETCTQEPIEFLFPNI